MDIEQSVRGYIVENFLLGDAGDFTNTQSLLDEGVIDSTGVLELVMFLEENHAINVADDEMVPENLDSVSNIAGFVRRKLDNKAADSVKTA